MVAVGIGRAIVEKFLAEGARVTFFDIDAAAAAKTAAELAATGRIDFVPCDVTAEGQVAALVELARRIRALKGHDLEEGASTRLLVYCASLIEAGASVREAVLAAMIEPLTDEPDVKVALVELADSLIR